MVADGLAPNRYQAFCHHHDDISWLTHIKSAQPNALHSKHSQMLKTHKSTSTCKRVVTKLPEHRSYDSIALSHLLYFIRINQWRAAWGLVCNKQESKAWINNCISGKKHVIWWQLSSIITLSNITHYHVQHCNDTGRTQIRGLIQYKDTILPV